jgi:hypothetical protein
MFGLAGAACMGMHPSQAAHKSRKIGFLGIIIASSL